MSPRFPIVVFDLDGTLVDSAPDLRAALNAMLDERGRPPLSLEQVTGMIGDGAPTLVARALEATGGARADDDPAALTRRFLDIYEGAAAVLTRPYPGTERALRVLRDAGRRLGVCTNKPQAATERLLAELDLARFFDAVAGGDALPVRKPDPRHLLHVVSALGGGPGQAVMVGDNANDVAAARAAGLPVLAVTFGYPRMAPEELGADRLVGRMADLPAALRALEAAHAGESAG